MGANFRKSVKSDRVKILRIGSFCIKNWKNISYNFYLKSGLDLDMIMFNVYYT